jgi:ABC-type multidrug transport system permease subunit
MDSRRYVPIWQLTQVRIKEFLRQPAAVFWVYGFPILMMISLGIAFRDDQREEIRVDLVTADGSRPASEHPPAALAALRDKLAGDDRFHVAVEPKDDWQKRLQAGKTDLVVVVSPQGGRQFWIEPHRTESRVAQYAVEAKLLESAPSQAPAPTVKRLEAPGSRYIDFLLPGMIGMGLMGGGLWGVGFVVVDMRVRKLLKRFLATPMRRSDFLLAIMSSRLVFTLADVVVLLFFGYLVFDVRCQGSYLDLSFAVLLGAAAFAGIGLMVASRAQTLETVSGLMNLVMLPMWVFSGVFFSSERFPQAAQPIINALPLTALNQLLRGIILEGDSLPALWSQIAILAAYGCITFAVALRVFRWR